MIALEIAASLLLSLQAQDKAKRQTQATQEFIDLSRLELEGRAAFLIFSGDFDADPEAGGGLMARAPLPWFSRLLGMAKDDVGLFVDLTASTVSRDFDPEPEDPDGSVFLATIGLDYSFVRNATWVVRGLIGIQYSDFGDVTGLDSGTGLLVGAAASISLGKGFWLSYTPEMSFGDSGDWIFINNLGLAIDF